MKRYFKFLLSFTSIIMALSVCVLPAQASNFTAQADALNQMGLFLGTGNGYELDRVPTRAEAAVMLVRLLGKESEVKTGTYIHPFKDVPAWVNNYVGYLYENGLTKGTSSSAFSPGVNCSSQMYTVFALRTLGYTEENGSFTYDQAVQFAQDIGLTDSASADSFLRDDMVALSYSVLFQNEKDNTSTKLEQLISDKSVNQSVAEKYLASYQTYKEYAVTCATSYIDISSFMRTITTANVSIADQTLNYNLQSDTKTVVDGDNIIVYSIDVENDENGYSETPTYYANGWLYTEPNNSGGWSKSQAYLDKSDYIAATTLTPVPFYLLSNITKTTSGNDIIFTLNYSAETYNSILATGFAGIEDVFDPGSLRIKTLQEVTTFGSNGKLKSQTITDNMSASLSDNGIVYPATIDITAKINVLETGDTITITLPSDLP